MGIVWADIQIQVPDRTGSRINEESGPVPTFSGFTSGVWGQWSISRNELTSLKYEN